MENSKSCPLLLAAAVVAMGAGADRPQAAHSAVFVRLEYRDTHASKNRLHGPATGL